MTSFHHGDRIRYATTGEDGYPLVRYGFVGGEANDEGPVVVMLDGELGGDVVDLDKIEPVHIGNVVLTLDGADLLDDPSLRQGLVNLWSSEADQAGLEVRSIQLLGTGVRDSAGDGFALAELMSGGRQYVLRAVYELAAEEMVCVRADLPKRWER